MSDLIEVVTTFGNPSDARKLARALIEEQLAGCVQVGGPIESYYRWEGKLEKSEEWTCSIKSTQQLYDQLLKRLDELHPYDEPQVVVHQIRQTSDSYGAWLRAQLRET